MGGEFWTSIMIVLKIAFYFFQYFVTKAEQKKAAAKKIADEFTSLEKKGHNIMRDILVEQGRTAWIPWNEVPHIDNPPEGV